MTEVLDLAEARARTAIRKIPDGSYSFCDYVEGLRPQDLNFIHVVMTKTDDRIELDFSGSDPQTQAAINFVSGSRTHPFLSFAISIYVLTAEPTTPINGGLVRPITTRAPKGTIMNADVPGGERQPLGHRGAHLRCGDGLPQPGPAGRPRRRRALASRRWSPSPHATR